MGRTEFSQKGRCAVSPTSHFFYQYVTWDRGAYTMRQAHLASAASVCVPHTTCVVELILRRLLSQYPTQGTGIQSKLQKLDFRCSISTIYVLY